MLDAAGRAAEFHDDEWQSRAEGLGDYVFPKGAPIPWDGLMQPYNQSHAMGRLLVALYRVTRGRRYSDRIDAMLGSFKKGLVATGGTAVTWTYWPVDSEVYAGYTADQGLPTFTPEFLPAQQMEDISHAAISVEFVYAAAKAGFRQAQELLPQLAATYTDEMAIGDLTVSWRVDGTGTTTPANYVQCARWGACASVDTRVYAHALKVWQANALTLDSGSYALAVAYLNWGRLEG